jgi:hypothetical protein
MRFQGQQRKHSYRKEEYKILHFFSLAFYFVFYFHIESVWNMIQYLLLWMVNMKATIRKVDMKATIRMADKKVTIRKEPQN